MQQQCHTRRGCPDTNPSQSGKEKEGRRGETAPAHKCSTTLAQVEKKKKEGEERMHQLTSAAQL